MLPDVGDGRLHRADVALEGKEVLARERGVGIPLEGIDLFGERTQSAGDFLAHRGEGVGRAVHGERLARQEVVHLGLEDGRDVRVGVVAARGLVDCKVVHLEGERVDLRGAAVAEQAQLHNFVVQFAVHAPVVGVRRAHFVVVPLQGVELAVELRKHVRERVLRVDRRLDRLAGAGRQVDFGERPRRAGAGPDGGGELRAGELV